MNDDIRGTLSRAMPPDLPAPRIDLDTLEQEGEKLVKRRRFGLTGMASTGVAVVAALALTLPTALVSGAEQDDAAGNGEQKAYPLPDLDPDEIYGWIGIDDEKQTEATKELTEEFWAYLTQKYPDLKVHNENYVEDDSGDDSGDDPGDDPTGGPDENQEKYLEPEDYPTFLRGENSLATVKDAVKDEWPDVQGSAIMDEDPSGYTKPVYGMPTEEGLTGAIRTDLKKDAAFIDAFDISVHPKGSFGDGAKSIPGHPGRGPLLPYLAEGCEDEVGPGKTENDTEGYEYDCEESTVPGGGKVHKIEQTANGGEEAPDEIAHRVNTVIVTLANGNAVVINDMAEGDHEPTMSTDELTELALALPDVVVE
ncbi:hypothetical protein [Stackebrandtia nassauensis]|uniref:Uncharacterized protein n=1 Tax=Stackebrandtia nassauensis (strain DSM 44728 / CIP 108903 / NRRL B-16338 / NBRC 102104 / LLR-40K-21) TaxID=446470 RepID=D3Q072_STANL|nr:hypothetical protein [Stackebrandtia nassauensis]ADD45601.1 hypothetical protein Snas_5975 [Stackebrandtia nassauensis DSM 44728]